MRSTSVIFALSVLLIGTPGDVDAQHQITVHDARRTTPTGPRVLTPTLDTQAGLAYLDVRGVAGDGLVARTMNPAVLSPVEKSVRGRNALVGALIGGGAVAALITYQCSHVTDCYGVGPGAALVVAAGMGVGAIVALLLTPVP